MQNLYAVLSWKHNGTSLDGIIGKVFTRLEKVVCLIKEERGANDAVEDKRGKKYENMKFEDVSDDSDSYSENESEGEI